MIKGLLKIAVVLVLGILIYNFFFGTSEEKAQSKEVFQSAGKLAGSAWNLLKSEKEKFDAGKYDRALDQVGGAYRAIREQAQNLDSKVLKRLDDLETRKAQLQKEIDAIEQEDQKTSAAPPAPAKKGAAKPAAQEQQAAAKAADSANRKLQLMRELDKLMQDTDQLIKDAQEQ